MAQPTAVALLSSASAGKGAKLKGFEFPKAVHLDAEAFSIDNDLITPKMSLKRPQLLKFYKTKVKGGQKNLTYLLNYLLVVGEFMGTSLSATTGTGSKHSTPLQLVIDVCLLLLLHCRLTACTVL